MVQNSGYLVKTRGYCGDLAVGVLKRATVALRDQAKVSRAYGLQPSKLLTISATSILRPGG